MAPDCSHAPHESGSPQLATRNPRILALISPGFTLLELLLAMLISTLVMSILSVALSFSLRMWERHQNRPQKDAYQVFQHMALQLGTLDTTPVRVGDETKPIFFGGETSLTFATSHSLKSLSKGVPVIARYVFRDDEQKLYYGEMPLNPNQPDLVKQFLEMDPKDVDLWPPFYSMDVARLTFTFLEREKEGALSRVGTKGSGSTRNKGNKMKTPARESSKSGIDPELLDGVLVQADTADGSSTINRLMVPKFMDFGSKGSNIEPPATN